MYRKWSLLLGSTCLMVSTQTLYAANVINVQGVEQGRQQSANKNSETKYILHLASFKSEHNAREYAKHVQAKTTEKVRITHTKFYNVVIGPLDNVDALHRVSQQLDPHKQPIPSTISKTNPISTQSHATLIEKISPQSIAWPNVVTVSLGAGWPSNFQNNQTILLETDIEKTYTTPGSSRALAQGEIFAGWQKILPRQMTGQFGVALGASTNASLRGHIWEDADPDFNNFDYGYTITHSQVALEGKLLATTWQTVMPYVNASVGVGFNEARRFTITPLISEEVAAPAFNSKTTTAFTYTVGAGIQKPISTNWQAGVGYAFSDWGKSSLSKATGQTLNNTPSLSHFYVNSLVFNISYLR